jgi:predicted XRE-type DNA-binding protein
VRKTLEERFNENFIKLSDNECWEWKHIYSGEKYGQIKINGKTERAHRVAWELNIGKIPHGIDVLHHCDNPKCVNWIKHLFLGTQKDNMQDMKNKNRCSHTNWTKGENNGSHKLTKEEVIEIKNIKGLLQREIGEIFNITQGHVSKIQNGRNW